MTKYTEVNMDLVDITASLVQSHQQKMVLFAFARVKGTEIHQLHPLVRCRDFLSDAIADTHNPGLLDGRKVYGFTMGGEQIETNQTRMLVAFEDGLDPNKYVHFLHHFETYMKWKKTTFEKVDHPEEDNVYLLTSSKQWIKTTWQISLYSLLVRLIAHKPAKCEDNYKSFADSLEFGNDRDYLTKIRRNPRISIKFLLRNHRAINKGTNCIGHSESETGPVSDTYSVHQHNGITGLLNRIAQSGGSVAGQNLYKLINKGG